MGDRGHRRLSSLICFAVVVLITDSAAQAQTRLRGTVEDYVTGAPVFANITAYRQNTRSGVEAGCPVFTTRESVTSSSAAQGDFNITLPADLSSFVATICATGYWPRSEPAVPNRANNAHFLPNPVRLYPREGTFATFSTTVSNTVGAFTRDLQYLQEVNPEWLESALMELGNRQETEQGRALFRALSDFIRSRLEPRGS